MVSGIAKTNSISRRRRSPLRTYSAKDWGPTLAYHAIVSLLEAVESVSMLLLPSTSISMTDMQSTRRCAQTRSARGRRAGGGRGHDVGADGGARRTGGAAAVDDAVVLLGDVGDGEQEASRWARAGAARRRWLVASRASISTARRPRAELTDRAPGAAGASWEPPSRRRSGATVSKRVESLHRCSTRRARRSASGPRTRRASSASRRRRPPRSRASNGGRGTSTTCEVSARRRAATLECWEAHEYKILNKD